MTTDITLRHINANFVVCDKAVAEEQLRESLSELAGTVLFGATSSRREQGSGVCSSPEVA